MEIDPQIVGDQFLCTFNTMAQNGHHKLARSLSGLARVTRVDDNLWNAICYNSAQEKRTPFMYVCKKGDVDRVNFLLPHCGAEELYHQYSDRDGPLFIAAENGHPEVVDILCKYIKDHNIAGGLDFRGFYHMTPLMAAAKQLYQHPLAFLHLPGHREKYQSVIACLVKYGCDLEAYDSNGDTVLIRAINCEDVETVKFLCMMGADVNRIAGKPWYPLHAAIENNNLEIATILCDYGADVRRRTITGLSMADFARTIIMDRWLQGRSHEGMKQMIKMLESRC